MPKSLISIQDFTKEEILHILDVAEEFEKNNTGIIEITHGEMAKAINDYNKR